MNQELFEMIAARADEMYKGAVDRLIEHRRAGRFHAAMAQAENVRHYLAFRRSAHRWLAKACRPHPRADSGRVGAA